MRKGNKHIEVGYDKTGEQHLKIWKARGDWTLEEMREFLRDNSPGVYAVILDARETSYPDWRAMDGPPEYRVYDAEDFWDLTAKIREEGEA